MLSNFHPWLRLFETYFVRLSLFHFTSALLPLILLNGASEGDGVDVYAADLSLVAKVNLLIYLITFILAALRWKKILNLVTKEVFYWPFLLVAASSVLWSSLPDTTFRGVVYALGTTLFGIYFASRYSLREQLGHITWTLGFIMISSLLFVVALPHYGIMGGIHVGAIRGVYLHKNVFSPMIILAVVVFFLQAQEGGRNKWYLWGLFVLTVAFGIMSRSSTAIGLMIVMLGICTSFRIFRWRYEILVSSMLALVIVGGGAVVWLVQFGGADLIFEALGKDATLSSRTEIWYHVWIKIQEQPLLGYGLSGFWNGLNGPSAYIERVMRTQVHYAHNGFLDLCLSFGFIGLSFFLVHFSVLVSKSLAILRKSNTIVGFWPIVLMAYIFMTNLTEGNLSSLSTFAWVLYTSMSFSLADVVRSRASRSPQVLGSRYDFG